MNATLQYYNSDSIKVENDIFSQVQRMIFSLNDYEREEFEERAAIIEFSGGLSQEEAEWHALRMTIEKRMRVAV